MLIQVRRPRFLELQLGLFQKYPSFNEGLVLMPSLGNVCWIANLHNQEEENNESPL